MANLAKPVPLIGGPDDAALFESTNSAEAPLTTEAEAAPEAPPEPKTAAEAKAAEDAEEADGDPPEEAPQPRQRGVRVPLSEMLTEREKRQAAELKTAALEATQQQRDREFQALQRQIADLQKPKVETAIPDFWEDPSKSVQHQVTQAVGPIQQQMLFNARLIAEQVHTAATVKAAADAFDAMSSTGQIDPADQRRIASSPNPFHEAVLWNKRRTALAEVGDDLGAFKSKLRTEAMNDPEFRKAAMAAWRDEAVANATGNAGTNLPSLNRATGAGSAAADASRWTSDAELFDETNQPRRRA